MKYKMSNKLDLSENAKKTEIRAKISKAITESYDGNYDTGFLIIEILKELIDEENEKIFASMDIHSIT